jgi:hypothetical protein
MSDIRESMAEHADSPVQPFYYEIRVKGRLSEERWMSWFDDLVITTEKGETVLRGALPDRTALYGLLARFRDLAVPLVSVNVLDADAQRALQKKDRRYDVLIEVLVISAYVVLVGGLATGTVLVSSVINVALALAILFALLGSLATAFYLFSRRKYWRIVTLCMWPSAVLSYLIFVAVSGILPTALALSLVFIVLGAGLVFAVLLLRSRSEAVKRVLIEWESLAGGKEERRGGTGGEGQADK